MKGKPDFYLTSTETVFEPRACLIEKRVIFEGWADDLLVISISPCIIGQPYGLGCNNIEQIALAVRHVGKTLFPINEWPMYVHICRIINDDILELGKATKKDIQIIMWGEIYKTLDEATVISEEFKTK